MFCFIILKRDLDTVEPGKDMFRKHSSNMMHRILVRKKCAIFRGLHALLFYQFVLFFSKIPYVKFVREQTTYHRKIEIIHSSISWGLSEWNDAESKGEYWGRVTNLYPAGRCHRTAIILEPSICMWN